MSDDGSGSGGVGDGGTLSPNDTIKRVSSHCDVVSAYAIFMSGT